MTLKEVRRQTNCLIVCDGPNRRPFSLLSNHDINWISRCSSNHDINWIKGFILVYFVSESVRMVQQTGSFRTQEFKRRSQPDFKIRLVSTILTTFCCTRSVYIYRQPLQISWRSGQSIRFTIGRLWVRAPLGHQPRKSKSNILSSKKRNTIMMFPNRRKICIIM